MNEAPFTRPLKWFKTGSREFPYVSGDMKIRVNDFPAEPLYTLMKGDSEIRNFDNWPELWTKESSS